MVVASVSAHVGCVPLSHWQASVILDSACHADEQAPLVCGGEGVVLQGAGLK